MKQLLALFCLLSCAPIPVKAAPVEYTIDSSQSILKISGNLGAAQLLPQAAGSDSTRYFGKLRGDLTGGTLALDTSHAGSAFQNVPLLPGQEDGDTQISYGLKAQTPAGEVVLSLSALSFYFSTQFRAPLDVSDGIFIPSEVGFFLSSGSLHYSAAGTGRKYADLHGYGAPNRATAPGTLTRNGNVETLTIPVATTFNVTDNEGTYVVTLSFAGQIVATRAVEPVDGRELHVVGVYEGTGGGTGGKIAVDRPGKSVTLFLSAYDSMNWQVTVAPNTTIERVFLHGYYEQNVVGIPAEVPVFRNSYEGGTGYVFVSYSINSSRFLRSIPAINEITGQEISSFHGAYQAPAEPFVIDSVQNDPRLSYSNPKPVPLDQLPNVRYQVATWNHFGPVKVQEFTLAGPSGNGPVIPDGMRVSPDAEKKFYYGGDDGLTKVEATTGSSQHIPLPEIFAREGWQMGTAFDTLRGRGLVVTLAGEGFMYAYNPADGQWTTAFSMRNRDFDCLEYHAAGDTLWGVTISHEDSVYAKLVGVKAADGSVAKEIQLPIFPFDIDHFDHRAEVVSTGEYLVLLIQPRSSYVGPGRSVKEWRIYLVDPRTGDLWLTYRRTAPLNEPPRVQIVSPTANQSVTAGSKLRISASAYDPDGSVQSVEFFVDDASLGLGTPAGGSAYHIEWTVPESGEHTIVAKAKDNAGATGVSEPVVVRVNKPPTVQLVKPEDGSTVPAQEPVDLKAVATDADGTIAAVHFIVDGLPLGPSRRVEGTDEYVLRWTPSRPGDHTIQARATDSHGAVAFSSVATVTVLAPPASVRITHPVDGSSFVQFTPVELVAAATGFGEMASVEFFVDGESLGRARRLRGVGTFAMIWLARGVGEHEITAKATTRSGETATSEAVTVTVTSEGGTARRLLPARYRPGRELRVGILVTPGRDAESFTVTETPPAGWSVSGISDGGTFDAASGKITFGPAPANNVRLLTYSVTPPPGTKGTQTFSGSLDVDGAVTSILGQQTINGPNAKRPTLGWKVGVK